MSTIYLPDSKQVLAMAQYGTDAAKQRMDEAIDSEEARDELIAGRAQEIATRRMQEMAPIDVVAGLQSCLENGAAKIIRQHMMNGHKDLVGAICMGLIEQYITNDSECMAQDWMDRIDRETGLEH